MIYTYQLRYLKKRMKTNLLTESKAIFHSVKSVLPNATVLVSNNYYRIMLATPPSRGDLIKIGRLISSSSPRLRNLATPHSNGTHIFRRK